MGWSQHYHEDSDCIYCSRFVVVPVKKNQRTKNLLLYLLKKNLKSLFTEAAEAKPGTVNECITAVQEKQ